MKIIDFIRKIFNKQKSLAQANESENKLKELDKNKQTSFDAINSIEEITLIIGNEYKYVINNKSIIYCNEKESIKTKKNINNDEFTNFIKVIMEDIKKWKNEFFIDVEGNAWEFTVKYNNNSKERYSSDDKFPENWEIFIKTFICFAERSDVSTYVENFIKTLIYITLAAENPPEYKSLSCCGLFASYNATDIFDFISNKMPKKHPAMTLYESILGLEVMQFMKVKVETGIKIFDYVKKFPDEDKIILNKVKNSNDIDKLVKAIINLEVCQLDESIEQCNIKTQDKNNEFENNITYIKMKSERTNLILEIPTSLSIINRENYRKLGISEKTDYIVYNLQNEVMSIVCDGICKVNQYYEFFEACKLNINEMRKSGLKIIDIQEQNNYISDTYFKEIEEKAVPVIVEDAKNNRYIQIYFIVGECLFVACWKIDNKLDMKTITNENMNSEFFDVLKLIFKNNNVVDMKENIKIHNINLINKPEKEVTYYDNNIERKKERYGVDIKCPVCKFKFKLNWNVPEDEEIFYCKCPNCRSEIKQKNQYFIG